MHATTNIERVVDLTSWMRRSVLTPVATLGLRLQAFAVPIRAAACSSELAIRLHIEVGHILRRRTTVSEAFLRVAEII
jgi:hypothetical protein